MLPGGHAQMSGRIKIGDQLVSVNGKALDKQNLREACLSVRDASRPVTFVIDRNPNWRDEDDKMHNEHLNMVHFGLSANGEYYTARADESFEDAARSAGGPVSLVARVYKLCA